MPITISKLKGNAKRSTARLDRCVFNHAKLGDELASDDILLIEKGADCTLANSSGVDALRVWDAEPDPNKWIRISWQLLGGGKTIADGFELPCPTTKLKLLRLTTQAPARTTFVVSEVVPPAES